MGGRRFKKGLGGGANQPLSPFFYLLLPIFSFFIILFVILIICLIVILIVCTLLLLLYSLCTYFVYSTLILLCYVGFIAQTVPKWSEIHPRRAVDAGAGCLQLSGPILSPSWARLGPRLGPMLCGVHSPNGPQMV